MSQQETPNVLDLVCYAIQRRPKKCYALKVRFETEGIGGHFG